MRLKNNRLLGLEKEEKNPPSIYINRAPPYKVESIGPSEQVYGFQNFSVKIN